MYVKDWVILFNMGEICKSYKNMADSSQLILLLILEFEAFVALISKIFSVKIWKKEEMCGI